MRHLASLKFKTGASKAIVSICSLLLLKVTSKGVFSSGRDSLELIVLFPLAVELCVDSDLEHCFSSDEAMYRTGLDNEKVLFKVFLYFLGLRNENLFKKLLVCRTVRDTILS